MTTKQNKGLRRGSARMGAAMLSFFFLLSPPMVALANVDKEAAEADEPEYEESVVEETTDKQPFSIEGNGQILDHAEDDDTKEFLTVQTKNNQTFFVVIDRAGSANNVYMLSMIDEDDLSEFIKDGKTEKAGLTLPEKKEKTEDELLAEEEAKKEKEAALAAERRQDGIIHTALYIAAFIVILVAVCGLYYYLKFYKPKKDEENAGSENLEDTDDFWGDSDEEEDDEFWEKLAESARDRSNRGSAEEAGNESGEAQTNEDADNDIDNEEMEDEH